MKQVASMQQSGIEDLLTLNTSISLRYIKATIDFQINNLASFIPLFTLFAIIIASG